MTLSVLIVEDNAGDADLAQEFLDEARGFTTEWVDRLEQAVERLTSRDCVLLDLGLPDSQGLETLRRVRATDPNVAVVVLTGRDDEELGLAALQEGAQDYVVKGSVSPRGMARAVRHAVERKRLDRHKSEFIARAAHELRSPLTVLAALGETLARRFDSMDRDKIDEILTALDRQGRRARLLVSNLLDLSQLEMAGMSLNIETVEVADVVASAIESAPAPGEKVVTVDLSTPLSCTCDAARLEQLLVNLLTNAYKYGGRNICINGGQHGSEIALRVADDGQGVPQDLRRQLFEPFTRGSNTASAEGSGLGLAIAHGLAEHLGGHLSYEENQPQGAVFVATLPVNGPSPD